MTRLALLALLSLLSSSVTGSGMIVCEYDDECPASQVCRMVCTRTCRALCVSFGVPTLVNGHRTAPDEPFIAELDPFMRDAPIESATPLTISEAELERELQSDATTFPTPPSGVILTSKSFRPSTTAPRRAAVRVVTSHTTVSPLTLPPSPPVPVTASMQATTPTGPPPLSESAETDLPPSPSPMPPGFTPDHESGYFTTETVSIEHETVEDDNSLEKSTTEIGEGTEEDTETPISDSTEAAESLAESSTIGCPAPPICEKNCGIYVGDDGCQTCQCLWLSSPCEADSDCVENNQFCDLGRCECKPGFVQDMLQSGICKVDSDTPSESDSELQNVGEGEVHNELLETQDSFVAAPSEDQLLAQEASGYASHGGRFRRSQVAEKPSRMERLQWPGPCDRDSQCPPQLYCIQGDCWHVPDKPLRGLHVLLDGEVAPKPVKAAQEESKEEQNEEATATPLPEESPFLRTTIASVSPPAAAWGNPERKIHLDILPPSIMPPEEEFPTIRPELSVSRSKHVTPVAASISLERPPLTREPDSRLKLKSLPTPRSRNALVDPEGWQPMKPPVERVELPVVKRAPQRKDISMPIAFDYTLRNRMHRPVRIEIRNAKEVLRDECTTDRQCGEHFVCCEKQWCDQSRDCGLARFCLPDCRMTKMTHLASTGISGLPLIDLVYD